MGGIRNILDGLRHNAAGLSRHWFRLTPAGKNGWFGNHSGNQLRVPLLPWW